ncbi:GNAT family N-acetyltransferase [Ferruginibacter lapsinanis]|uniref:GNAT family N-acetyltransferase n=1 Tax=Ferruginibacter lapsinanis TaxID=563172 RepID=UPI001E2EFBDA|nr:GNAT family N-acetyltransferase [Ferruginibacter lapsinanis]UEG49235.1 GNAT family N-acetyltransferase [Ferruginibacter lapsinanis]
MISIKKVGEEAIPAIHSLARSIWPIAYKNIITDEQIDYMLELMYSPTSLQQQILEKKHQFIMAYENDLPVGYSSYSIKSETEINTYRLHKLYVSVDQQRKGIATRLLNYIISDIQPTGATAIQLNVNKMNPSVLFYTAKGFTVAEEQMLDIGNGFFMDDYIMQLMC